MSLHDSIPVLWIRFGFCLSAISSNIRLLDRESVIEQQRYPALQQCSNGRIVNMTHSLTPLTALFAFLGIAIVTTATQDFVGPGSVSCPTADYAASPCVPTFLNGNPLTCIGEGLTCRLSLPNVTIDRVLIPIPCGCLVANDCPDSCTLLTNGVLIDPSNFTDDAFTNITDDRFATDDDSATTDDDRNSTSTGTQYVGRGVVTCPFDDYFLLPCLPDYSNLEDCVDSEEELCNDISDAPEADVNFVDFYIFLPCRCVTVENCPETCTFAAISDNTTTTTASPTGTVSPAPEAVFTPSPSSALNETEPPETASPSSAPNETSLSPAPVAQATMAPLAAVPATPEPSSSIPTATTTMTTPPSVPNNTAPVAAANATPTVTPRNTPSPTLQGPSSSAVHHSQRVLVSLVGMLMVLSLV